MKTNTTPSAAPKTLWVMYISFINSKIIYLIISIFFISPLDVSGPMSLLGMIVLAGVTMAACFSGIGLLYTFGLPRGWNSDLGQLRHNIHGQEAERPMRFFRRLQSRTLLSGALCEAGAIAGLFSAYFGAPVWFFCSLIGFAVLCTLTFVPKISVSLGEFGEMLRAESGHSGPIS